jgi:hypothetical protein
LTLSVVAMFVGVAALLGALDVVEVDVEVVGAIALALLGTGLIVSAWYGRARGLIPLAVLVSLALTVVAVVDTPLEGGIGERDYHPTTRAELDDEYRLAIGSMTLDLRDVPFAAGVTAVEASVGIGELEVLVPSDVRIDVRGEAGIGRVVLFGASDDGTSVVSDEITTGSATRELRLELRTGIGQVQVAHTEGGLR